jgi:hypothetical protein
MLTTILTWLSGKKGTIAIILEGVIAYLASKSLIGEPEVILFTVILGALFGTASYATGKLVYGK